MKQGPEHTDTLNQVARYVHSVMKMHAENRAFDGLPTMAIIFYNGQANWNPLNNLMDGYSSYFRNSVLPFRCAFVNMSDIPDSDCLACEDTATGVADTINVFRDLGVSPEKKAEAQARLDTKKSQQ